MTTSTGQPDHQPATWPDYLDSTDAAQALGISLDALRKRIARGTIEATKRDGHWYVRTPDGSTSTDPPPDRTPTGPEVDGAALALAAQDSRIASLERQLEAKDDQLQAKDSQIGELHRLMAQAALSAAPGKPWWKLW